MMIYAGAPCANQLCENLYQKEPDAGLVKPMIVAGTVQMVEAKMTGMNVLTGETGAGKSFIIKALGFLLGDKLAADMVRAGAERAQVEALFSAKDADTLLRRELVAETGRSRLYINDELRSQDSLRDLRNRLVAHTSQHA